MFFNENEQNPVIRRIQFGAKNILCDSNDHQMKDKRAISSTGRQGVENVKCEVHTNYSNVR